MHFLTGGFVPTCRGVLGNKDQPRHVKTLELLLHFGGKVNQPNLVLGLSKLGVWSEIGTKLCCM